MVVDESLSPRKSPAERTAAPSSCSPAKPTPNPTAAAAPAAGGGGGVQAGQVMGRGGGQPGGVETTAASKQQQQQAGVVGGVAKKPQQPCALFMTVAERRRLKQQQVVLLDSRWELVNMHAIIARGWLCCWTAGGCLHVHSDVDLVLEGGCAAGVPRT
eukprot:scaffold44802_cov17-Tisochrysis_lutea.AAC.1